MASRITPPTRAPYNEDFYVWTREQADHLHARRLDALDLDNLILEVEALGDSKRDAALNNAGVVMGQQPRPL